jgi:membrane-associated phospholipid phosphatase
VTTLEEPRPVAAEAPLGSPPTVRLLLAAVVSIGIAALVYVVFVRTALGQRFDNAALAGSRLQLAATRATDVSQLQRITADSFAVALVLIAIFGVLRGRPRLGIGAAVAAAIAVIGTDALKEHLLTRPTLVHSDRILTSNTFPSGHTATAIACALALIMVTRPRWRGVAAVVAGTYAWVTAAQVQTAGWHRSSDAIGAALLGFAAVAMVAALLSRWRPIGYVGRPRHRAALSVLGVVWLVAAATAGFEAVRVIRYLRDHDPSLALTRAVQNDAYHFSVSLTVVVVVSLIMTMLVLLRGCDLDQPAT